MNSTELLEPMLATEACSPNAHPATPSKRISPTAAPSRIIARASTSARRWSSPRRCVAVEAMEGTDATILRAGEIMRSPSWARAFHPEPLTHR